MSKDKESLPAAAVSQPPCEDALIREYLDAQVRAASEEFDRAVRFGVEGFPGVSRGGAAFIVGSPDTADYVPYMGVKRS